LNEAESPSPGGAQAPAYNIHVCMKPILYFVLNARCHVGHATRLAGHIVVARGPVSLDCQLQSVSNRWTKLCNARNLIHHGDRCKLPHIHTFIRSHDTSRPRARVTSCARSCSACPFDRMCAQHEERPRDRRRPPRSKPRSRSRRRSSRAGRRPPAPSCRTAPAR